MAARSESVQSARATKPKSTLKRRTPRARAAAPLAPAASAHKFTNVFGPAFPKGRVLTSGGESVTLLAGARQGLCVHQFAPCPERMSWIYVTQGLAQISGDERKARRRETVELILSWKRQDPKTAARVLADAARQILESQSALASSEIISCAAQQALGFQHWLACSPEDCCCIPQRVESVRLVLLLGISDAEMQCAMKVKPEIADGRQVLQEALRAGGIFPVSDPERTCLTRRGDFHRLWENAFRVVRERR